MKCLASNHAVLIYCISAPEYHNPYNVLINALFANGVAELKQDPSCVSTIFHFASRTVNVQTRLDLIISPALEHVERSPEITSRSHRYGTSSSVCTDGGSI